LAAHRIRRRAPCSKLPKLAATKRQDKAVRRAAVGAIMLKKSMRDPDSFKLESALVINGTGAA
jgi:hypothetical protein